MQTELARHGIVETERVGCDLVIAAILVGGGLQTWSLDHAPTAARPASGTDLAGQAHIYPQDRCPLEPAAAIGVLARVTPAGAAAGQLAGRPAKPLLSTDPQHSRPVAGTNDLVVIQAKEDIDGAKRMASQLPPSALVKTAAVIGRASRDTALHTCDGNLTDSPGAQKVAAIAAKAMVAGGFVTEQAISDRDTVVWVVTDDPLDASLVIVIAWVPAGPNLTATPFTAPPGRPPEKMIIRQAVSALVNPQSGTVASVGYSPF